MSETAIGSTVPIFGACPQSGGVPPTLTDRFAPRIIVGNVPAGDPAVGQAAPFEYIPDPGDGSGIAAALAALPPSGGDIWIRPGTYDLDAGPGTLVVPSFATVRGSGEGTIILGSTTARTVFDLSAAFSSRVENLEVRVPTPVVGAAGLHVIALATQTHVHDVTIRYVGIASLDESLVGGIGGVAPTGCQLSNLNVGGPRNISPSGPFACYDFAGAFNQLSNAFASGADIGLRVDGTDHTVTNLLLNAVVLGAELSGSRLRVNLVGSTGGGNGVTCIGLDASSIEALITNGGAALSFVGVSVDGACDGVTLVQCDLKNFATGVDILAGALRCNLGFSNLVGNTTPFADAGTSTEVGHNQV